MKDVSLESLGGARTGDPVPEDVQRILESQTFERSPALRVLLTYLWKHRAESLSEFAIATEALGRSASFDARIDATVRVQVSRLRQRLERYYEKENARAARRLAIPLGSHQIIWDERGAAPVVDDANTEIAITFPDLGLLQPARVLDRRPFLPLLLIGALLVCLLEAGYLIRLRMQVAELQRPAVATRAPRFWQNFFATQRPTRIALPTPVFFSFGREPGANRGALMLRDTEINEFSQGPTSPVYQLLAKSLGPPALAENYTVTSDTFAAVRLARYLDEVGFQTSVASSADNPMEAMDRENLIAIGTWGTLAPLSPYLEAMSFELGPHEASVTLRHPAKGDPKRIEGVTESAERGIWPGVIGFLPSRNQGSHLLVLASRHTSALVSFLTSSDGLDQLEQLWRKKGSPQYFEVVVCAEISGRAILRTWPVALQPHLEHQ